MQPISRLWNFWKILPAVIETSILDHFYWCCGERQGVEIDTLCLFPVRKFIFQVILNLVGIGLTGFLSCPLLFFDCPVAIGLH